MTINSRVPNVEILHSSFLIVLFLSPLLFVRLGKISPGHSWDFLAEKGKGTVMLRGQSHVLPFWKSVPGLLLVCSSCKNTPGISMASYQGRNGLFSFHYPYRCLQIKELNSCTNSQTYGILSSLIHFYNLEEFRSVGNFILPFENRI